MNDTSFSSFDKVMARMTDRERRLAGITAAVFIVLLLAGVFWLVNSALSSKRSRIKGHREDIAQLDALRAPYDAAVDAEKKSSAKLKSNQTQLFSLIQNAAKELNVPIADLNEKNIAVKDADVREFSADVAVKEASIDKLNQLAKPNVTQRPSAALNLRQHARSGS